MLHELAREPDSPCCHIIMAPSIYQLAPLQVAALDRVSNSIGTALGAPFEKW